LYEKYNTRMNNEAIAAIFKRIANLLEIKGENRFKVLAYRRAAESIHSISTDLIEFDEQELMQFPAIGKAIAGKIQELNRTGKLEFLEKLEQEIPPTLIDLLELQDIGHKKAALFWKEVGITTIEELEIAARAGRLQNLPGMGEKSEGRILKRIEEKKASIKRFPINVVFEIAKDWKTRLEKFQGVHRIEIAGSLRRILPTIGDLDLVGIAEENESVMDFFTSQREVAEILSSGTNKSSIMLSNGVRIQLWLQSKERFGSLLQFVTGSKAHNIRLREFALKKGLSLSEHGFVTKDLKEILCPLEVDVYATLGLAFIPPELREDKGEIPAAERQELPNLIERSNILSDLHIHTIWSDGSHHITEMALSAENRGLEAIAITDHTPASFKQCNHNFISLDSLDKQKMEIDSIQKSLSSPLTILKGIEVEILSDGKLDFPDEVLSELDIVLASIHTNLDDSKANITRRLINAIQNPHVDIIGHPSGREYPFEGIEADWDEVFKAAADCDTALEINSNPLHLDLNEQRAARAVELGAWLAINSDAHSSKDLDNMDFGIGIARRAWLEPDRFINTWSTGELISWLKERG